MVSLDGTMAIVRSMTFVARGQSADQLPDAMLSAKATIHTGFEHTLQLS